jgi:hypothetical protein
MNFGRYSDFGSGPGSADFADPYSGPDFDPGSGFDRSDSGRYYLDSCRSSCFSSYASPSLP